MNFNPRSPTERGVDAYADAVGKSGYHPTQLARASAAVRATGCLAEWRLVRRARSTPSGSLGAAPAQPAHDGASPAPGMPLARPSRLSTCPCPTFLDTSSHSPTRFGLTKRSQRSTRVAGRTSNISPKCHVRHAYCMIGMSRGLADREVDPVPLTGCDDEPPQAQRWVGVRLPNPAGRRIGRHREGDVGLASNYTERGETPGSWSDLGWPASRASVPGMRSPRSR
jgi:hypothetical protein